MVHCKMYVTGGLGAMPKFEGFGADYYLPNQTAYCEICSSVAGGFFDENMNLAFADVVVLSRALIDWYRKRNSDGMESYSATALRRVWKAERFSWWLTTLMHRLEHATPFERRMQAAELDYVTSSPAAMTTLAENYVGLPLA